MWAGLAVDNTAESVAAGALYSEAAGKFAVIAKTTRNATIGFVVLGYAIYVGWTGRRQHRGIGGGRRPLLRGRGQVRCDREDDAERDDWVRRSRLRDLCGLDWPSTTPRNRWRPAPSTPRPRASSL